MLGWRNATSKAKEKFGQLDFASGRAISFVGGAMRKLSVVAALLALVPAAHAQTTSVPIKFDGQIRVRNESDAKDFNSDTDINSFSLLKSLASDEMQQRVDQVTAAMREQTQTAAEVVQSVEETSQVVQQSLDATHKMSESTDDLARQAENLKRLSQSFDNKESVAEQASGEENGYGQKIDAPLNAHKLN